ncbi:hypothetical protein ABMA27_003040 [Loxostege sticticalis]|uniref:DDE-1 domain-containing protein n=1 Tax=Loxostege sticticalis TaxID=481309 RepID=A0ABR3HRS4_LOXSC
MGRTKVAHRKKGRGKGSHAARNMLRALRLHRQGWSLRKAAKECQVSFQTLHRYVKKNDNVNTAELGAQRLTPNYDVNRVFQTEQEEALKEYIKECALKLYGLSTKDVRRIAYQMAIVNNIKIPDSWRLEKMAGYEWLRSFRSRHQDLTLKKPEACSLARATAFNEEAVKKFFCNLKEVMQRHPSFGNGCRVYNLDETATTTVQKPQKVIAPKGRQNIGKITSGEKGTLVTTCAIVCAAGHALPPVLDFPRKHYKDHMLTGAPPGSLGLANLSGWMTAELFIKVMEHFIKHTSASPENPALLIMDNHESHLSVEALDLAKQSGVTILTLHPHTTAKMQPLDRYGLLVDENYQQITIYNIAELVGQAYTKAMTPNNIASSFKKCGIFPFNSDVFNEIDFMPSEVSSRELLNIPTDLQDDKFINHSSSEQPLERQNPFGSTSILTNIENPTEIIEESSKDTMYFAIQESDNRNSLSSDVTDAESPVLQFNEIPSEHVVTRNNESPSILDSTPSKPISFASELKLTTTNFKSPNEFMPPLKSEPRVGKRKPRKLGRSLIATDTPEKLQITKERQKAKERKSAAKAMKRPILVEKNHEVLKRKTKRKKVKIASDIETSEEENTEYYFSEACK